MGIIINEGQHNTNNGKHAVKCDMREELRKLYDEAMKGEDGIYVCDTNMDIALDFSNNNQDSELSCLICGLMSVNLEQDIVQYIDPSTVDVEFLTLKNGANVILCKAMGEESFSEMVSVVYYDGDKLSVYTPYEGNGVYIDLKTALGDEELTPCQEEYPDEDIIGYYEKNGLDNPFDDEIEIPLDMDRIKAEIEMVLGAE